MIENDKNADGLSNDQETINNKLKEFEQLRIGLQRADNIADIVWILDMDFRTIYVSPSIKNILGYTPEERKRQTVEEMISPESLPRIVTMLAEELKRDGTQGVDPDRYTTIEVEYYHADGHTLWMENNAKALRDDTGTIIGIYGTSRDITKRKQTEEALRESEKRFRDISDNMADWVWETDADGKYTYASGKVEEIMGYKTEELLGKTPFDFMPEDEAVRVLEIFKKIVSNKKPIVDLENWNIAKNGDDICLLTNGMPLMNEKGVLVGYRGVDKDITGRKHTEEKLRDYSENMKQMVEKRTKEARDSADWSRILLASVSDSVYVYNRGADGSVGNILEVNDIACKTLGYTREELLKMRPNELVYGDTGLDYKAMRKALYEKKCLIFETAYRTKNGGRIPIEISTNLFKHAGKTVSVSIARNLTNRIQEKAVLLEAQEKLFNAEKLSAIGQLASGVAHQLRNPLGVINNAAYFIKLKYSGIDEQLNRYTDIIKGETEKAAAVINGILDFARMRQPEKKPAKVATLIAKAIKNVNVPRNIKVMLELDENVPEMPLDTVQVAQVFINVITNAIQAMPKGGTLSVYSHNTNGFAQIDFVDTGCGIPAEQMDSIFEPLFTTRENRGGTGIGLTLCRTIIRAHNGSIDISSEVDQGTSLAIKLPLKS